MRAANNCDILHYLHWTFDLLVNNKDSIYLTQHHMKTRLILCSVHFFKNVIRKTKKLRSFKNVEFLRSRKIFLFSFTLLLNSTCVVEFDNHLVNIFNVFGSGKLTRAVLYSLKSLQYEVKSKNLNSVDICKSETATEIQNRLERTKREEISKRQEPLETSRPFLSKEEGSDKTSEPNNPLRSNTHIYCGYSKEALITASPFTNYYKDLLSRLMLSISCSDNIENDCEVNPYFFPEFLKIIREKLYIMPLWTSCMAKQARDQFPEKLSLISFPLDDNPSESNFMHLKHYILNGKKNLLTSEITPLMYNQVKAKFYRYYVNKNLTINNMISNEHDLLSNIEETWKPELRKRKKGYWFENCQNFDIKKWEFEKAIDDLNNLDFDLAFDLVSDCSQEILKSITDEKKFQSSIIQAIKSIYISLKNSSNIFIVVDTFKKYRDVFEAFINSLRKINIYFKYKDQIVDKSFDEVLALNEYLTSNELSIVNCSKDGDCFYSSISILLFGHEKFNDIIKICCFFVIFDHFDSFKEFASLNNYGKNLEVIIVELLRDKVWANELIIFSAAILLDRPIITFSTRPINQSFEISRADNGLKPLLIAFLNNHFSPILSKYDLTEQFFSTNIQYKNIKDIFHVIKYY